jgi:uncharacterized membrane protein
MAGDGFRTDFKRNFLTGFAALFPIVLTLVLLLWIYTKVDKYIGTRVNGLVATAIAREPTIFDRIFKKDHAEIVAAGQDPREYARARMPRAVGVLIGLGLVLLAVYMIGSTLRGYIGRRVMRLVDRFFERFPVIKQIYPHAREFTNLVVSSRGKRRLGQVVAVPYPRRGIYSLGFKTGKALKRVTDAVGRETATVFIPTSPTPLTGFIIFVPSEEVIELDLPTDEALRFILTGGMVMPKRERQGAVSGIYHVDTTVLADALESRRIGPGAAPEPPKAAGPAAEGGEEDEDEQGDRPPGARPN